MENQLSYHDENNHLLSKNIELYTRKRFYIQLNSVFAISRIRVAFYIIEYWNEIKIICIFEVSYLWLHLNSHQSGSEICVTYCYNQRVFDWWVGVLATRDAWRCTPTESGAQYVTTAGTAQTPGWCVKC